MSETFEELRQTSGVDGDAMVQAARYYLAERTDDLDSEEMFSRMEAHTGQPAVLNAELERLVSDSTRLEAAAAGLLAWAWDDPAEQAAVRRAIDAAKVKLPIIETAILGMVALYGMYLVATGGKKSEVRRTTGADGATREATTEYYPHPLAAIVELFRKGQTRK